jgi:uncharacterized protein
MSLLIPEFQNLKQKITGLPTPLRPEVKVSEEILLDNVSAPRSVGDHKKCSEESFLARLAINVSNTCNMSCEYCYANEGTYYSEDSLMSESTALNTVNFFIRNYSTIGLVNFFGGEPTLNVPVIEMICSYFSYLKERGIISFFPRFGLTTNGYKLDDRLLDLVKRYDFRVTISIDGPEIIHNLLRLDRKGQPTYNSVKRSIHKLQEIGIQPEIECTYTQKHIDRGLSVSNLMDFFYKEFQCGTLHCPIVITESDSSLFVPLSTALPIYSEAIRESIRNIANGVPKTLSTAARFLDAMVNQTPITQYCGAGASLMAVNSDGSIYPCFMLMNEKVNRIGDVNHTHHESTQKEILRILAEADKYSHPSCQKCWIQPLCFGCLGEDFVRNGKSIKRSAMTERVELCDFKRRIVESFLVSVLDIQLHESQ